ncbi:MAG TPA: ADP-ribosylglycohydrolase family protein [Gemmatimonadaceae bacterium]|nr:ADP-ribosylglycohydrolase family protein [Gemmatimonadaceae bacterium]
MLGALAGDIIGSVFEWASALSRDFPLFSARSDFTDDSVLTFAVARAILDARAAGSDAPDYGGRILEFGRRYPNRGYGEMFHEWLQLEEQRPYNSFGNGSAMRVSPVGFAFDDEQIVLEQARRSAIPTHDHPEGIKGAQSVALAVWMARRGAGHEEIRSRIGREFAYDLQRTVDGIQPGYTFDVTCQGSVPESIIAFLDADDFEAAIRNAVWLGGDADTQACIAGAIAEAVWGVPAEIEREVRARLPEELLAILDEFREACAD